MAQAWLYNQLLKGRWRYQVRQYRSALVGQALEGLLDQQTEAANATELRWLVVVGACGCSSVNFRNSA